MIMHAMNEENSHMTNDIAKKMALAAIDALEDKKAEDIQIIDIGEVSPLADYFMIANGTNTKSA